MNALSAITPAGLDQFAGLDDRDILLLISYLTDKLSDDVHDAMPSLADAFECVEDARSYPHPFPHDAMPRALRIAAMDAFRADRDRRLVRVIGGGL